MLQSNNKNDRRRGGFTLVEVVVVLGVILLLAGIAVPLVTGYIEDSQRGRARSEVKMLGASMMSMYKDLGQFPARDGSGNPNRVRVIGSGPSVPTANPFRNNSNWNTWFMNASYGDVMDNHLVVNEPQGAAAAAYSTSGEFQWRGPYLPEGAPLDPWGRPYVCMVRSFWDTHATNFRRVIILSAGPDGQMDTSPACTSTTEIADDDIGMILSQR